MIADKRRTKRSQCRGTRRGVLAACVCAIAVFTTAGPGVPAGAHAQELRAPPTAVSLQEAVDIAMRRSPGRVVRAVTVDAGGGRRVHEVRILSDEGGRVVTVRVDAQTGRLR